jgi:hypothetical protein
MKPGKKLSIAFICFTALSGNAMSCKKDSPLISMKGLFLTVLIKSLVLFPSFRLHLLPEFNEEVWN